MSIATVLWLLAVSGLVTGVAGTASAALRRLGRPERWVWIVALGVTAALPFLPVPSPAVDAGGNASATAARTLPIAQMVTLASASLPEPARVSVPWIPLLWGVASAATVLAMLGGAWSLARRRERWPRRRIDGDLLRVSDRFGPAVVGWIDPEIVLPAWALDLEARQRRLILRHENEHRWAKDPRLLALGVFMLAAAPWNPLAWLQFRGLRRAVEFDCDGRVLDSGASPRAYGRLLLSVQLDGARGFLFAPALREPASFLERRLQTMKFRHLPVSRLRVAGLALAAVAMGVVACETPKPTERVDDAEMDLMGVTAEFLESAPSTFEAVEVPVEVDPADIVVFEVGTDGAVNVRRVADANGQRISSARIGQAWQHQATDGIDPIALVRVAPDTPYATVESVLDELRSAGATKISLQLWGEESEVADEPHTIDAPVIIREQPTVSGQSSSGRLTVRGVPSIRAGEPVPAGTLRSIELWEPENATPEQRAPDATAKSILGARLDGSPLIYVDGVRMGTEREEGGDILERIRPDDIERIEIVKGEAAERLWGADAANGVIQIFTKRND